jgi:acetyl esterase/lipase
MPIRTKVKAAAALASLAMVAVPAPAFAAPGKETNEQLQRSGGYNALPGLSYAELPGNAGTVDLYLPQNTKGPTPVVLWTHGSAWLSDNGNEFGEVVAKELTRHGYAVAAVAIRSSGQAQFPAQVHDAKAAVRWLRANAEEYHLDGDRIAAMGDSSGGWTSTMLGVTANDPELEGNVGITGGSSEVQAVVDMYGPTDFLQMDENMIAGACSFFNTLMGISECHNDAQSPESRLIGGAIQDNQDRASKASPITYVDSDTPPFLIAHGVEDMLVPNHQSSLLFEAMAKSGVPATFYSVQGYGHDYSFLSETVDHADRIVKRTKPNGGTTTSGGAPMTWDTVARFLDRELARD